MNPVVSLSANLGALTSGGSAKKRWLRQAISESADNSAAAAAAAASAATSPPAASSIASSMENAASSSVITCPSPSHPPPAAVSSVASSDSATPLKKRRLARHSSEMLMSPSDVFLDSPLKEVDETAEGVKSEAVKTETAVGPINVDQPITVEDAMVAHSPKKEVKDEVKE